jgi:phage portal protein BeeE
MAKKTPKSRPGRTLSLPQGMVAAAAAQTRDVTAQIAAPVVAPYVAPVIIYPTAYPLSIVEAAGLAAVRRCVSLIANAVAGRDWQEWEGETKLTPSRIVRRPAASMPRREWAWRVIASLLLDDISYLWMVGGVDDEGVPGSIVPLPRAAVSAAGLVDPWGIFPPTQYTISGVPGIVSGEAIIPLRSAIWPGVPAHLAGVLQMARNEMMASWSADTYAARYWQAGGSPVTVLRTEQDLTDGQAEGIGNRWRDRRTMGPDFPAVLSNGADAKPFGADVSNAVAVEARREMTLEVGRLFGVDGRYLDVTPVGGSQSYSNINDDALTLERFTLGGVIDPIQDVISELLPGDYQEGRRMVIDMTPLTRPGMEARYRSWAIATGNKPWMAPSEVRDQEGLEPDKTFDEEPEPAPVVAPDPTAETVNPVDRTEVPVNA